MGCGMWVINQVFQSNQAALSRAIIVNQATIGLWSKGKIIPQLDKLLLLIHYFKINLLDFLTTDVLVFDNQDFYPNATPSEQPKKSYQRITSERKQVLNIVGSDNWVFKPKNQGLRKP